MKILIIEDEARIARRLERMIRSILGGEVEDISICDSLDEGQATIEKQAIDLLFLDLNLNGENGFEVLQAVVAESFHTIVVSAYKDRAIEAFEYGVLDFVPKPFDELRLAKACQRIRLRQKEQEGLKFLAIKKKGKRFLVNISDIKYIKGAGIYTELFLKNGHKEMHNKSLENLMLLLPDSFERIHKSYVVEMKAAQEIVIEPGSKYSLRMHNGEQLPIGRTRYKMLQEKWFS